MLADPKLEPRVEDPEIFRVLHLEWRECVLCHNVFDLSLHHISKHPRDDLRANLVCLCGSGTTGCHGLIEAHDEKTTRALGRYLMRHRPDFLEYLTWRKKTETAARAWVRLNLLVG